LISKRIGEIQRVEMRGNLMGSTTTETFSQDSYNHGGLITFLISMAVSIIFFIVLLIVHPGVDLKEQAPNEAANPEAGPPSPPSDNKAQ
jgi:hypothetical protein